MLARQIGKRAISLPKCCLRADTSTIGVKCANTLLARNFVNYSRTSNIIGKTEKYVRPASTATSVKPDPGQYFSDVPPKSTSPETSKTADSTPRSASDSSLPLVRVDERKVYVGWDPLTWSRYLNFWLRDHCRCPECFHQTTKQRLVNTFDIPPDIQPSKAEATAEGLKVTCYSSSTKPHISIYPWNWLKWHSPEPVPLQSFEEPPVQYNEKVLWGAKIVQDPPSVAHDNVMNDDFGLWKLLKKIDTFGFCFVQGVEATPEATEQLTRRIANIRQTQYGTFWDFTSNLAKGDTAYTTLALGAHTDTTYFTDPCGLQLFHLLSHTDGHGGETLLVDGFYVAAILKELHPEAYHTLTSVRVPTHAAGEPGEFYRPTPPAGYPILNLDPQTGKLYQVRYNNDDRSAMRGVSSEELERWYEALRLWDQTLKSPDSEYWVQLSPGTAVIVDNHRVLHGRSAFDGKRRMCGAYIGMDDFRSELTVLTERFGRGPEAVGEPENTPSGERSNWSPLF
ncbi:Trimethyllysine dioxygenase [Fomitiporia mediterranea MF3/22]|uniref:Trimethyllysine dioxygenase n=1 Tax=Fomitiporia mediterranea (strain MF3/22) TaxID=694068 RepID=UPI0004409676|nr:Trimethyllysine dioxygenase [Fomitiporia mediterranea MF3/22]EJD06705.1 Trimethyllysine dioxygenase [Fomitiporia mediterranea MF3/22]